MTGKIPDDERLDLTPLLDHLHEIRAKALALDGQPVKKHVETTQQQGEINRGLLYLAHLLDVARVEAASHYFHFRGEDPPQLLL